MIRKKFELWSSRVKGRLERVYTRNKVLSRIFKGRWLEFLYVIGIIFMVAGTVSALIQPVSINQLFVGRNAQTVFQTMINIIALLLGSAGIYVSYLSGRQTTKPRIVSFLLILGLMLIATSVFIGIYLYSATA